MTISTNNSISRALLIAKLHNQLRLELDKMESGKHEYHFISHQLRALKKDIATIDISLHAAQRKYHELSLSSSLSSTSIDELDAQAEIIQRLTRIEFSYLQRKRELKEDLVNLIIAGNLINQRISEITKTLSETQTEDPESCHL